MLDSFGMVLLRLLWHFLLSEFGMITFMVLGRSVTRFLEMSGRLY